MIEICTAFLLGTSAKFFIHLFFPYEGGELWLFLIVPCFFIFGYCKRKLIGYFFCAIGFSVYELIVPTNFWFGITYHQYGAYSVGYSFFTFTTLALLLHYILIGILKIKTRWKYYRLNNH